MVKGLVSIVLINWNGIIDLKDCLPSLRKVKYPKVEIILVDHGSKDGSIEYVKKNFPEIKLIETKKNLGFALGNNVGYEKTKGEYVLILNNDTIVTSDFLDYLVETLRAEGVGVVQPKIIFADTKKLQTAGTYLTNSGFLYHVGYDKNPREKKYNNRTKIFSANGACMLIKREIIGKVGLFDKDFFLYFEETDFCWRVWLAGYSILYEPRAVIFHKGSRATKTLPSAFVNFHSFKNRINTIIKNAGVLELIKILPLHIFLCFIAACFFFLMGKVKLGTSVLNAIFWNLANMRKTLGKRKIVQEKIREISDKSLMKIIKRKVRPIYFYYLFTGLERYED